MIPPPLALGLTVCEKAIIEDGTRDVTLVSIFRERLVDGFPSPPQSFTVYAVLTDGLGDAIMEFVISNLETDAEIYRRRFAIRFPDRLVELRLLLRVKKCSFPTPGKYQVTLLVDGDWIAQCHMRIAAPEDRS
jgi:hypothetical protein